MVRFLLYIYVYMITDVDIPLLKCCIRTQIDYHSSSSSSAAVTPAYGSYLAFASSDFGMCDGPVVRRTGSSSAAGVAAGPDSEGDDHLSREAISIVHGGDGMGMIAVSLDRTSSAFSSAWVRSSASSSSDGTGTTYENTASSSSSGEGSSSKRDTSSGGRPSAEEDGGGVCYFYGYGTGSTAASREKCREGGGSCAVDETETLPFSTAFFVHEVLSMASPSQTPHNSPHSLPGSSSSDEGDGAGGVDGDFQLFSRVSPAPSSSVDMTSPAASTAPQGPLVPRGDDIIGLGAGGSTIKVSNSTSSCSLA